MVFLRTLSGPEACRAPGFANPRKEVCRWDGRSGSVPFLGRDGELVSVGAKSHGSPRYPGLSLFAKGWFCSKLSLYSFNLSSLKYPQASWPVTETQTSMVKFVLMKLAPNAETNPPVTPLRVRLCHLLFGLFGHPQQTASPHPPPRHRLKPSATGLCPRAERNCVGDGVEIALAQDGKAREAVRASCSKG